VTGQRLGVGLAGDVPQGSALWRSASERLTSLAFDYNVPTKAISEVVEAAIADPMFTV
jgi:hypothetical protein